MSDFIDFREFEATARNPYGPGPFRFTGALVVLQKQGTLPYPIYFRTFTSLRPPWRGQMWTRLLSQAKRFHDERIAHEFIRFLDAMPDRPDGTTTILKVIEENPLPRRAPKVIVTADESRTAMQWLMRSRGVNGQRKGLSK